MGYWVHKIKFTFLGISFGYNNLLMEYDDFITAPCVRTPLVLAMCHDGELGEVQEL